jgi:gp16 family phage-associated protein
MHVFALVGQDPSRQAPVCDLTNEEMSKLTNKARKQPIGTKLGRTSHGNCARQKREKLKQLFEANGLTVTEWAAARGFKRDQVYAVLNGRAAGRRGASHRIAIALGLKPEPREILKIDQELPANQAR